MPLPKSLMYGPHRPRSERESGPLCGPEDEQSPARPGSLHKGLFVQRESRDAVYAGWRAAKRCCFIESIGDRFAQC